MTNYSPINSILSVYTVCNWHVRFQRGFDSDQRVTLNFIEFIALETSKTSVVMDTCAWGGGSYDVKKT